MRVQYYTPEGEKLPVAVNLRQHGIQKILSVELGGEHGRSVETEGGSFHAVKMGDCHLGTVLYASDFTEEELKELKDEKDL